MEECKKIIYGEIIEIIESYINLKNEKKLLGYYVIYKIFWWYGLNFVNKIDDGVSIIKYGQSTELKDIKQLLSKFNNKTISHGDIVVCPRPIFGIDFDIYTHWGIYDEKEGCILEYVGGNGETISNLKNSCQLRETPIDQFLKREPIINTFTGLQKSKDKLLYNPDQVVKRARDLINNNNVNKEYSVLFRNCQHFSTYCSTGKGYSVDVKKKIESALKYFSQWKGIEEKYSNLASLVIEFLLNQNNPFQN